MNSQRLLPFLVFFISLFCGFSSYAQKDTSGKEDRNIFELAFKAFKRSTPDTVQKPVVNTGANFKRFEGKAIRSITIRQLGFERNFTDTAEQITYGGTRILNKLHKTSRSWVIKNNLFFKEQDIVHGNVLADNERYLRSLEFIRDARIILKQAIGEPDSVDVYVITKDLFSISGQVHSLAPRDFDLEVFDANSFGLGQKIGGNVLYDIRRAPAFGYGLYLLQRNIGSSFINATAGYSTANNDLLNGSRDEHTWYVHFDRPLVSQYMQFAGAVAVSHSFSNNSFGIPDSLFFHYTYNLYDAWGGINLGVKRFMIQKDYLLRKFVALRYLKYEFTDIPFQVGDNYFFRFNSRNAVLGSLTIFKQHYYKTNYILGFGTTEDLPYGFTATATAGWYKQMFRSRMYAGVEGAHNFINANGQFIQYYARLGSFFYKGSAEDVSLLTGVNIFSRIYQLGNVKLREYLQASYAQIFNRIGLDPLKINNYFGIRYFNSDSAAGDSRVSIHTESIFFTQPKIFGFRVAPFVTGDFSLLTQAGHTFGASGLFYGIGAGLRTRNENLVFGTIELRMNYFPRRIPGISGFTTSISTNLSFRRTSNYVKAPDIVQLNIEGDDFIY